MIELFRPVLNATLSDTSAWLNAQSWNLKITVLWLPIIDVENFRYSVVEPNPCRVATLRYACTLYAASV